MSFERTECILHKISPGSFPIRKQPTRGHLHLRERPKKQPDVLFEEALNYLKEGGFRLTKPREVIVRAAIAFAETFSCRRSLGQGASTGSRDFVGDDLSHAADAARQSLDSRG